MLLSSVEKLALALGHGSPFFRPRSAFKVSMSGFRDPPDAVTGRRNQIRTAKRIRTLVYVNFLYLTIYNFIGYGVKFLRKII